jgi:hypothetical protein
MACETAAQLWNLICSWTDACPIEAEVSLQELTTEMKMRMNSLPNAPPGFNHTQLHMDSILADQLPKDSVDHSPDKLFSRPFSLCEIAEAKSHITKHSTGTTVGIDDFGYNNIMAIPNENIQGLVQGCIDSKDIPTQWLASLIIGIAKTGKDPSIASSYRLIALECCLLKFTTLLIDLRIRCYTNLHNIIPESQNGFQTGFRTNNNLFILRTMTDRAVQQGMPLYVAYIDLHNAFPATNRPTLWVKLNALGISGKIIDWLKMLYDKMVYMVKLNGQLSESFLSDMGVLTGDTVSPTLWNIFLADFKFTVHPEDISLNNVPIPKLEQADDIMIATTSPSAFQSKLNDLVVYASNNGCETQLEKCLHCISGKRPKLVQEFTLGDHTMTEVSQFQYAGIHFRMNSREMFSQQYKVNLEKASQMSNICLAINRMVGFLPAWDACTLYMAHVDPYLTAGCEVSLDVDHTHRESLETVQHHHLR